MYENRTLRGVFNRRRPIVGRANPLLVDEQSPNAGQCQWLLHVGNA
jgi:hypothetical protein